MPTKTLREIAATVVARRISLLLEQRYNFPDDNVVDQARVDNEIVYYIMNASESDAELIVKHMQSPLLRAEFFWLLQCDHFQRLVEDFLTQDNIDNPNAKISAKSYLETYQLALSLSLEINPTLPLHSAKHIAAFNLALENIFRSCLSYEFKVKGRAPVSIHINDAQSYAHALHYEAGTRIGKEEWNFGFDNFIHFTYLGLLSALNSLYLSLDDHGKHAALKENINAALPSAAGNGHFDMALWWYEKLDEEGKRAALKADSRVFRRAKVNDYRVFRRAAENGHFDMALWVYEKLDEEDKPAALKACDYDAFLWAVENGHFDIVKWVYEKLDEEGKRAALKAHGDPMFHRDDAIQVAEQKGHFDIGKWLCSRLDINVRTNTLTAEHGESIPSPQVQPSTAAVHLMTVAYSLSITSGGLSDTSTPASSERSVCLSNKT